MSLSQSTGSDRRWRDARNADLEAKVPTTPPKQLEFAAPWKRSFPHLLRPVLRGRLAGHKVGAYIDGNVAIARLDQGWTPLRTHHGDCYEYKVGKFRLIAACHQSTVYGSFHNATDGELFQDRGFWITRSRDGSLRGGPATSDHIKWIHGQFGIFTHAVLWHVRPGTSESLQPPRYLPFHEMSALSGTRSIEIPPVSVMGHAWPALLYIEKSNCAAGFPEEALVVQLGNYLFPVPEVGVSLLGWSGTRHVEISRIQNFLTVSSRPLVGVENDAVNAECDRTTFDLDRRRSSEPISDSGR
jgi:hypothetical protein